MNGASKISKADNSGFTLMEILVAMFVGLIIASLMLLTFQRSSERHEAQTDKNELQQTLVGTLNLMEREIRLAGYHQPKDKIIKATPYTFTFMADLDNDGTITLDGNPNNDHPRTEKIKYYFDQSTGVLQRTRISGGTSKNKKVTDIATNLEELKFEYFDKEGNERASSLGEQYIRDEIRRIRVIAKGDVKVVATETEDGKPKKVFRTNRRTVTRDITPPNLGIPPLVPCGTLVVDPQSPIAACNPPGELSPVTITTYDKEGKKTNENNVSVTVNQSSTLYSDDDATTLATLPLPGGSRSEDGAILYLESGATTAGDEVIIEARWTPPEPKCFQRMSLATVSVAPGSACKITAENVEATACDAPGCENTKEIVFKVEDNCGNAVSGADARFWIIGNDDHDKGTLDGNYTDVNKVAETSNAAGEIKLEYKAPNNIAPKIVSVKGELLNYGTGCSDIYELNPITLVPCDPDSIGALLPEDPKGCMNQYYNIYGAVFDACSNPISNLTDFQVELLNPVGASGQKENVSKPDGSQPGNSVFMQPIDMFEGMIYEARYNTRTDDEDNAPREVTLRFTQPEVNDPLTGIINLTECTCNLLFTDYPETYCNRGISEGCPKNAILRATLDDPNNEAKIFTNDGVDIYYDYQNDYSEGPVSQTPRLPVNSNANTFVAVQNDTVTLGNTAWMYLEEYNLNDKVECTASYPIDVVCSAAEIEFLDEQYRPAITYDPYNPNEVIFVELEDCNRPDDKSIEVKLWAEESGDEEELELDKNPGPDDWGPSYYRNDTGFPITAIDDEYAQKAVSNDGILQVYAYDVIHVRYEDDTAQCQECPDIAMDKVELTNICTPMALYSGAFATFQGTSFRVHWGDVLVKGDVDFSGQLDKKVPRKDRTMSVSDTTDSYTGKGWTDRWVDIYIKGDMKSAPSSAVQPFYTSSPSYPNIFQHVTEENLDCIMSELDYEDLKQFAKDNDVYYYSTGNDTIRKPGDDSDRDFQTVLENEAREFIFVDIIDAPSYGNITGEDIDNGVYDAQFPTHSVSGNFFYEGFVYIAGNFRMSGLGSATAIKKVNSPPEQDVEQPVFPPNGDAELTDLPVTYDESLNSVENLTINAHIRGGVYIEGVMDVTGNPQILGSLAAEGGFTGSGNPEIWYDYQSSRSCVQASGDCCKISVEPVKADLNPGETKQFTAKGATDIKWRISDNQSGGTISSTGLYTAGNTLNVTDTIKAEDDKGDCISGTVRVNVVCPQINISGPTELQVGDTATYNASGGSGSYTYSVSNSNATINSTTGELEAITQGTVYITATDANGCSATKTLGIKSTPLCQTIFSDDFDGNVGGMPSRVSGDWSHNGSGQDDWQFGAPAGKCDDPSSAHSGANVMGNDIGETGWNGCYSNNVRNYVISSHFDLTGYEDPELHFYRWLNVRNGDDAEIYVNCDSGWEMVDSQTNVRDNSWQEIVMVAGAQSCDDHGDVQFAFLLDSNGNNTTGGWTIDDVVLCAHEIK